ncbi:MAG: aminotransferase class I/II-fold pyridoxal phosphate-dependent enzyme, partial [Spirochaetes bacterium]|nr:aminotransferase class I/II-fold pyridoxal phosphate-dependent enzyme [Spirochaetota bacterium]
MSISGLIKDSIEKSSWIRKMFEEGARLKAQFGAENVFDFSLGNPDVEPPADFFKVLQKLAADRTAGVHGYMPNAGFPSVRDSIAEKISTQHAVKLDKESVIMTCGAAGGMNVVMKTILDPGEEVIVVKPYFAEYGFYISNHQGKMIEVESGSDFSLDAGKIKKAITS